MAFSYTITRANGFYKYHDSHNEELVISAARLIMSTDDLSNFYQFDVLELDYTQCSNITATSPVDIIDQLAALTG